MPDETLAIVDNRTGREYTVPIVDGTIRATDLRQISATEGDGGLTSYDPAFLNTANCRSAITYIDGDAGILRYRGYPIEQLAEQASFLETAYLLLEGELPTAGQLCGRGRTRFALHTYVHTNLIKFLEGFRYDAHPMGMLLGAVGALSTFYPDAKDIVDPVNRRLQQVRLLAKMPTLAAFAFRHSRGLPYVYPRNDLDYVGNFVNMTFEIGGRARAEPGSAAIARDPARPSRRSRAELLDERRSRGRAPRRSTRSRRSRPASRRSTGRCTAAQTRPFSGCSTRSARPRTSRPSSRA